METIQRATVQKSDTRAIAWTVCSTNVRERPAHAAATRVVEPRRSRCHRCRQLHYRAHALCTGGNAGSVDAATRRARMAEQACPRRAQGVAHRRREDDDESVGTDEVVRVTLQLVDHHAWHTQTEWMESQRAARGQQGKGHAYAFQATMHSP